MSTHNNPSDKSNNPSRNEQIQAKFEVFKGLSIHFSSPVPLKQAISYAIIFGFYVGGVCLLHFRGASIWSEVLVTVTALTMGGFIFIATNDRNRNR